MAMSGGFAGGLAQGIRNGIGLYNAYEEGKERRRELEQQQREQEVNERIQAEISRASLGETAGAGGLMDMASEQPGSPAGASGTQGLSSALQQPLPPAAGTGPTAGLTDVLPDAQPGVAATGQGQGAKQPLQSKGGVPDEIRLLRGLSAGISEAWKLNRADHAMELMRQREVLAGPIRERAYGQALSQYQMTNDPRVFVPFVNDFLSTGLHIDDIEMAGQTSNGMPVYMLKGSDMQTGEAFSQAVSAGQLNSFIQGVADPATQRAMFVDQQRRAYEEAKALRDHEFRIIEDLSKPQKLGKDETLYVPDGRGGMRLAAAGVEAGASQGSGLSLKQVKDIIDRNKSLSSYVFKLNGVDSMSGIGEDQRQQIAATISLGESLNRLNPELKTLGDANTAQLAQALGSGNASVYPVRTDQGVGYATDYLGEQILIPASAVPATIRERFERQVQPASADAAKTPSQPVTDKPAVRKPSSKADSKAKAEQGSEDSDPEGSALDAAREERKQAARALRAIRAQAPGLKQLRDNPQRKIEFDEQVRAAEAVLRKAQEKEREARAAWNASTSNHPENKAFIGY
ncbi:hypothetical protein ACMHYO_16285 [Allopusillimonas ginsengisoli]|uniref:hypothetical protein n=1 Tax=Allopusillimonas ginsengisoli TaxID=453575 RepID=UPI0039C15207